MTRWLRYAALLAALAVPAAAHAQSAAERAAELNDQGKTLWLEQNDLPAAVEKFRQATELSPEPSYYFNLCYALHQLGRFREAQPACRSAQGPGADEQLRQKAQVVLDDIDKRLAEAPPETTDPGTGTDPTQPGDGDGTGDGIGDGTGDGIGDGTGDGIGSGVDETGGGVGGGTATGGPGYPEDPYAGGAGQPPSGPVPGLYQPAEIPDDYKWSVGAELGFVASSVGKDAFGNSGGAFKLFANVVWLPEQRIGAQGYLNISQLGDQEYSATLQVLDVGAAVYKHIPMRQFYVTPLLGAHLTGLQSEVFQVDALGTLGLRGEASVSMLLGEDRRHVLSVTPALSIYLPVNAAEGDAITYGLDKSGASLSLTFGYSLRFTTPFGQSSLITLE